MRYTQAKPIPQGTKFSEWEFLWLPLTIGRETRWLERAHVEYEKILFFTPVKFLND